MMVDMAYIYIFKQTAELHLDLYGRLNETQITSTAVDIYCIHDRLSMRPARAQPGHCVC